MSLNDKILNIINDKFISYNKTIIFATILGFSIFLIYSMNGIPTNAYATKMFKVTINTEGYDYNEAQEWVNELANTNDDLEVSDIHFIDSKIIFKAGLSGIDDTNADDIRMKLDEYIMMHEQFKVNNISVS